MNDPRVADNHMGFPVALAVLGHHHALVKAVLPPVRFVCHDHNIPAVGKRSFSLFKLEHGGKDDSVCRPPGEQGAEMLLACRLNRRLTEKLGTLAKLGVKLIVKIDAVGHHDNGRAM